MGKDDTNHIDTKVKIFNLFCLQFSKGNSSGINVIATSIIVLTQILLGHINW